MYFLYTLLLGTFSFLAFPFLFGKMLFSGRRRVLKQKFGFLPAELLARMEGSPRIWVHAVSAGEVSGIHPLIRELREVYPRACLLLSMGTASGKKIARERVSEASARFYFPLDLPWVVRRVIDRVRPDLFILAETELWPNFLRIVKGRGARTMLANGRISDRSFGRYRRTRFFWTGVLDHLDAMSMVRVQDGERIISMGADPVRVHVNGNCKFDQAISSASPRFVQEMRDLLEIGGEELLLVAGSTHEGEEEAVLQAFERIRRSHPEILLVLAPRHVERAGRVEKILARHGIGDFVRRSRLAQEGRRGRKVILWDTFGELFKVYSVGTIVFCGASLVPQRGQNILEAAAWGKVVLYGPSMEDFLDARQLLESVGAGLMVEGSEELAEKSLFLLNHGAERQARGEAGREIVRSQQGAARRNAELARKLIGR